MTADERTVMERAYQELVICDVCGEVVYGGCYTEVDCTELWGEEYVVCSRCLSLERAEQ